MMKEERSFSRSTIIEVCEVCLGHRSKTEKPLSLSTASVRVSLQEGRDAIGLTLLWRVP